MNTDRAGSEEHLLRAMSAFKQSGDYAFLMNCFGMIMVVSFQTNDFNLLQNAAKNLPVLSIVFKGGPARTDLIVGQFIVRCVERKRKPAPFVRRNGTGAFRHLCHNIPPVPFIRHDFESFAHTVSRLRARNPKARAETLRDL